jgi:aryl-alcohol dehydrogenase-like predicted oxidoreductase
MEDLIRAGKVRHIGASNYSAWHLMKGLGVADADGLPRYASHQIYYSLIGRDFEWELMPLALAENVGTLVFSPLAQGQLTGKFRRGRPVPKDTRLASDAVAGPPVIDELLYRVVDALDTVASETGRPIPQIAINWVLHRPAVSSVIVGARNEKQLRENLKVTEWSLSDEHAALLDAASAVPPPYPHWHQRLMSTERNPPPV